MSYVIDRQGTFDLVGGGADHEFDGGVHAESRTVHVARAMSGPIELGSWNLCAPAGQKACGPAIAPFVVLAPLTVCAQLGKGIE